MIFVLILWTWQIFISFHTGVKSNYVPAASNFPFANKFSTNILQHRGGGWFAAL
jgi:hypothetical protein